MKSVIAVSNNLYLLWVDDIKVSVYVALCLVRIKVALKFRFESVGCIIEIFPITVFDCPMNAILAVL